MKMYVLDTDIVTLYQHGNPRMAEHVLGHPVEQVAISVISVEEELTGWYTLLRKGRERKQLARVYLRLAQAVSFFGSFSILSFTEAAIERYEGLRKSHRRLGKHDLQIAAIGLEHRATVVTRNVRDFQQVDGLSIEDWSK